jgi:hypothetical protein
MPHYGAPDEPAKGRFVLAQAMPARPCLDDSSNFTVAAGTTIVHLGSHIDPLTPSGFDEAEIVDGAHAGRCVRLMWDAPGWVHPSSGSVDRDTQ